MVGASAVVTKSFGSKWPHKNSTGMPYERQQACGISHRQLEMFRGKTITDGYGFGEITGDYHGPASRKGYTNDVRSFHGRQQAFNTGLYGVEVATVGA